MKQKRILIVRHDRIGDVVLSTPIPREIKKTYPQSFVAVMVRKYTRDIYLNNPRVDKILLYDDIPIAGSKSFFQKVWELRTFHFTHALMLLPDQRINYLLFVAGIKTRIGVGHKFYQFVTWTKNVSRKKYNPIRHEADYCMDLARKIGVATEDLSTEIHLTESEKRMVIDRKIRICPKHEILVGIHTTHGYSSPNMNPGEYRKLINLLQSAPRVKVAVTDFEMDEDIQNIPGVIYFEKGETRDLILNIAAMDLLVSSSTGPCHIAAALKVKTFTLFCRLPACSPELWCPQGNEAHIILPDEKYCRTACKNDPRSCWFEGTGGIDAEKVYQTVLKILKLN